MSNTKNRAFQWLNTNHKEISNEKMNITNSMIHEIFDFEHLFYALNGLYPINFHVCWADGKAHNTIDLVDYQNNYEVVLTIQKEIL